MNENTNATIKVDLHYADLRKRPVSVEGLGAVVIRDPYGNPIIIARSYPTGHTVTSLAGDPDFKDRLAEVGVIQRVEVEQIMNIPRG